MGLMPIPTHSAVNIAATSTLAVAQNDKRRFLLIVNDSDTKMYVKFGAAAVDGAGVPLLPNGGNYEMTAEQGNLFTGAIYAIHGGTGNKTLLVTEG